VAHERPAGSASARHIELLDAAHAYVMANGLAELTLRPLAAAIGSSPRVLLYLFGSREGLIRAILARARRDELGFLDEIRRDAEDDPGAIFQVARTVWSWLVAEAHRPMLALWVEAYGRSLTDPTGPWNEFAEATVTDWLDVLASAQPEHTRGTARARDQRTSVLAALRGALLDLLATGDAQRTTAAVDHILTALHTAQSDDHYRS